MAAVFHMQRKVKEGNLWIDGAAWQNLAARFFFIPLRISIWDLTLSTRRNKQKQEGRSGLVCISCLSATVFLKNCPTALYFTDYSTTAFISHCK